MVPSRNRDLVLSCISKSKILKWHVKQEEEVKKDKVIASYVFTEKVSDASNFILQRKLKAKFNGKILELSVKPNEDVARGQVVARLQQQDCEHNTVMKDMCCDCGEDLRKEPGVPGDLIESTTANLPVVHNILELRVSAEEAARLAKYDEQQLLRARKLVLVVDLDMTLIHTTVASIPKNSKDVFSFRLPGHQYEYHTKLRPGARKFLESISKFYELHIFTMGSRMYAHTIAKCLDPEGKFFAHRIRSRDEFINSFSKFHDLKALFPCGDHMVCIIDDREDVWNYAPNLITVKPYKYFKSGDDINDPFKPQNNVTQTNNTSEEAIIIKGPKINDSDKNNGKINEDSDKNNGKINEDIKSDIAIKTIDKPINNSDKDSENDSPEKCQSESDNSLQQSDNGGETLQRTDSDDYLFYLDEILERVHYSFYSTLDAVKAKGGASSKEPDITKFCTYSTVNPDVRIILPELRRQTLKGCNIVFTGVIPTNCHLEKSRAWKTAISLGAKVSSHIIASNEGNTKTTHVIAARHGTHKAHKAFRNPDIHLVNPSWLWCSAERWEWAEESIFPVPLGDPSKSPVQSRQGTPQHNSLEGNVKVSKKKISPLADEGFEIASVVNVDGFLNPLNAFSKNERDAMDKEVEDFMSVDEESETSSIKSFSSNSSSKRKISKFDESINAQLKKKLLASIAKKSRLNEELRKGDEGSSSSSENEDDINSSSSSSSSTSDSNSSSDGEDKLAGLLEQEEDERKVVLETDEEYQATVALETNLE